MKNLNCLTGLQNEWIVAEKCRRKFYYFVQTFWNTIIAEEPVWNWHIEYLCDELQLIGQRVKERQPTEYTYYIINIPPGTSKSTIISQMYIAWMWIIDPTQRFICGSYSQTVARKDASFTQKIISSDKYRLLFPDVELTKDAVDLIRNTKNGERYATSVGSGVTGIHAHQIIIDDPLNPKQAASQAERITANEWIDHTLTTRKVDKKLTPTIVVMQRLHELDPTGHILRKGSKVKHICLPAESSSPVIPIELKERYVNGFLDPVRMDRMVLDDMRNNLGSYGYSGQMNQQPAPDEGGIIKKQWFKRFSLMDLPSTVKWNILSDPAYTKDERNDPSGLKAYCYHNNNFYIRDYSEVYYEFPELVKFLPKFADNNGYSSGSIMAIEPKASGKSLVQTLRKETGLNVVEDSSPFKDKIARATDISPVIESGRVYLLEGAGWVEHYLTTVSQFPNAAHDEAVDLLSMMINRHQKSKGITGWN